MHSMVVKRNKTEAMFQFMCRNYNICKQTTRNQNVYKSKPKVEKKSQNLINFEDIRVPYSLSVSDDERSLRVTGAGYDGVIEALEHNFLHGTSVQPSVDLNLAVRLLKDAL